MKLVFEFAWKKHQLFIQSSSSLLDGLQSTCSPSEHIVKCLKARTPALIRNKIQFYTHICPYCYCLHYEAISQSLDQAKLLIKMYSRKSHFGGRNKKALHEAQELGVWSQLGHRLAYLLPALINNINVLMFLISWEANWKHYQSLLMETLCTSGLDLHECSFLTAPTMEKNTCTKE